MLVRRETPSDIDAVRSVTTRAFIRAYGRDGTLPPIEIGILDELRADPGWLPALSLVAVVAGEVVGHAVCTRATVADTPVLGLGPVSVDPSHQRVGVGSALVHTMLGAADALGEPAVVLLGDPGYYARFGFVLAGTVGIEPPRPEWVPGFQVRTLSGYEESMRGLFTYAEPLQRS